MRNKPEVTALFAEREFEQECVFIERLLLNLRQTQWLRMERCVSWAASPNPGLDLFIFIGDGGDLFGGGGGLFGSVLAIQQVELRRRLRIEQLPQGVFALQQRIINVLTNVGAGLFQQFQQGARSGALAYR
jgi:hypothetical protein